MPEPPAIMAHAGRLLERPGDLAGVRVLVTAGPTREAVDPVRFLSNRSSGKMGVAIAEAAWRRGAEVTLVCGPLGVDVPLGPNIVPVETTEEMRAAVAERLGDTRVLIMAAAPADFRPDRVADEKIKKSAGLETIELAPTPDILRSTMDARVPGTVVVGFALETHSVIEHAKGKLAAKGLDLIVANDAREPGAGFGVDTNKITLIGRDGAPESLPLMEKRDVADAILDRVVVLRGP
jgi:phosphopantothenoylcysteine decarboxylase/phosphopantothenate--cysteine ligase